MKHISEPGIVRTLEPLERHHLTADDLGAMLLHPPQGQRLVACPPRADSFFEDEYVPPNGKKVEYGLQDTDMGLCPDYDPLLSVCTRELKQRIVGNGGEMCFLHDAVGRNARTQGLIRHADPCRTMFRHQHGDVDCLRHIDKPGRFGQDGVPAMNDGQ